MKPGSWAYLVFAVLVALLVNARSVGYPPVWDDELLLGLVDGTLARQGWGGLLTAEFRPDPGVPSGFYRPVVLLSLGIDAALSARLGWPPHLTNLLLHAANTGLVFLLLAALLRGAGVFGAGGDAGAFAGALWFGTTPVHVESVAFISGRTDLWAALFLLGCLLAWSGETPAGGAPAPARRALGAAALLLACLSKEAALLLPALLLGWDAFVAAVEPRERTERIRRLRAWAPPLGAAVLAFFVLRAILLRVPGDEPAAVLALPEAGALGGVVARYLGLLAIPWPLRALYTAEEAGPDGLSLLGSAATIAACVFLAGRRFGRLGALAAGCIGVFLAPVLLLSYRGIAMAERFLYVPSVGAALLVAVLAARFAAGRAAAVSRVVLALVIAAFAVGSFRRTAVWESPVAIFEEIVRGAPRAALGYNNLGAAYLRAGRDGEAVTAFRRAVELKPDYGEAHFNLGAAALQAGDAAAALAAYTEALRHLPGHGLVLWNLGRLHLEQGRVRQAIPLLSRAAAQSPADPGPHLDLSAALEAAGDLAGAARAARAALSISPGDAQIRSRVARLLAPRRTPGSGGGPSPAVPRR